MKKTKERKPGTKDQTRRYIYYCRCGAIAYANGTLLYDSRSKAWHCCEGYHKWITSDYWNEHDLGQIKHHLTLAGYYLEHNIYAVALPAEQPKPSAAEPGSSS